MLLSLVAATGAGEGRHHCLGRPPFRRLCQVEQRGAEGRLDEGQGEGGAGGLRLGGRRRRRQGPYARLL